MISKKRLRERLIDICNGGGMYWVTDLEYFDFEQGQLETVGKVIQAIERSFQLSENTRLRAPFRLKDFDDIAKLTELVYEAIEHDS